MAFTPHHTFCIYKLKKNAILVYLTDGLTYFFSYFKVHKICKSDMTFCVHHTHKTVNLDYFFKFVFLHFLTILKNLLFEAHALIIHWNKFKICRCTQHAHKQVFASVITCIYVSSFENNFISQLINTIFFTGNIIKWKWCFCYIIAWMYCKTNTLHIDI